MKVEIWSDIACPYCYIGKRKYEEALKKFPYASEIRTEWRSYQLDPELPAESTRNQYAYVADMKGCSPEESVQMHDQLTKLAKSVGLDYHFDRTMVANTFNAHRLSHFAAQKGLQDAAEEQLFKAFFTDGKDINDLETLVKIATSIGLNGEEVRRTLNSDDLEEEVFRDFEEAEELDVDVVPFFLFDRTLIVTGAQSSETFLDALNQTYEKWKKGTSASETTRGANGGTSCSIDGTCNT